MNRVMFFVLVIMLPVNGLLGQTTSNSETPEKLAVLFKQNSLTNPGFCAERMHPDALKLFKSLVLEFIQSTPIEGRETALSVLFDGAMNESQLATTSATQLYASFLRKLATQTAPNMTEFMAKAELTPLGSVIEGDMSHVVVRTSIKDADYRKLDVVSFKKHGNGWGGLLGEDLEFKIRNMIRSQRARRGPNP